MTAELIAQIEKKLQYTFKNKQLLKNAFTHSSYSREQKVKDNERLEFFGDAILDMVISEYLYANYAELEVGMLSTMRSNIVSADGLRPIVDSLDILKYLMVGYGFASVKHNSKKIESNLYEAIVAAIYLDGGLKPTRDFILLTLSDLLAHTDHFAHKDAKTMLQEYCQKRNMSAPQYQTLDRVGADNNPTYKCGVYVNGILECVGMGSSKKNAEQDAAKNLVAKWRINGALS